MSARMSSRVRLDHWPRRSSRSAYRSRAPAESVRTLSPAGCGTQPRGSRGRLLPACSHRQSAASRARAGSSPGLRRKVIAMSRWYQPGIAMAEPARGAMSLRGAAWGSALLTWLADVVRPTIGPAGHRSGHTWRRPGVLAVAGRSLHIWTLTSSFGQLRGAEGVFRDGWSCCVTTAGGGDAVGCGGGRLAVGMAGSL